MFAMLEGIVALYEVPVPLDEAWIWAPAMWSSCRGELCGGDVAGEMWREKWGEIMVIGVC